MAVAGDEALGSVTAVGHEEFAGRFLFQDHRQFESRSVAGGIEVLDQWSQHPSFSVNKTLAIPIVRPQLTEPFDVPSLIGLPKRKHSINAPLSQFTSLLVTAKPC